MALRGRIKVRGGDLLKRFAAKVRRNRQQLSGTKVEVGFFGPQISTLAALHEFGQRDADGGPKSPPRPAFRAALPKLRSEFRQSVRRNVEAESGVLITRAAVQEAAKAALHAIVESYRDAPGPQVGPAQQARKAGTLGEGRKLVGTRGEKLISHLQARVNGEKVN